MMHVCTAEVYVQSGTLRVIIRMTKVRAAINVSKKATNMRRIRCGVENEGTFIPDLANCNGRAAPTATIVGFSDNR